MAKVYYAEGAHRVVDLGKLEGYFVWLDSTGKWHTSHAYVMTPFTLGELRSQCDTTDVWAIPLPDEMRHHILGDWFEHQTAIEKFRYVALKIAKQDYKSKMLGGG